MVYNADEGLGAAALDFLHKLLRPATYPCDLCAITYGVFSMRGEWREWLAAQPFAAEFHHRQDFSRSYPAHAHLPLPAILRRDGDELALLLGHDNMRADMSVRQLIAAVELRLSGAPA